MNSKQQVTRRFSEVAPQWAAMYADTELRTQEARNVASRLMFTLQLVQKAVPRGSKILDVGCGPGDVALKLSECGYDVWGIDIAEPMVRCARIRCGPQQFHVGDVEAIPFEDDSFDAVLCLAVIEYLDSDERALHEIKRVLRNNGRAVIATPSAICPLQKIDRTLAEIARAAEFMKHRLSGKTPPAADPAAQSRGRRYYRRRLIRLLNRVGFEAEEWLCHGWGWYRTDLIARAVDLVSRNGKSFRHAYEQFLGPESISRATDRFVRNSLLNWLAAEQMVRVRVRK